MDGAPGLSGKREIKMRVFWIVSIVALTVLSCGGPRYEAPEINAVTTDFNEWYQGKRTASSEAGVRKNNEERYVPAAGPSPEYTILYIHGFKASRAEGEYVVDRLAKAINANVYYLRLPGHGTTKEDHANTTYDMLIDEAVEALAMVQQTAPKVILIGTSMGGNIATWVAAHYPDYVDRLILVSPFYDFLEGMPRIGTMPGLFWLYTKINPLSTSPAKVPDEEDNWTAYWYRKSYTRSIQLLRDLKALTGRKAVFEKITVPVLMLYAEGDEYASIDSMKEAYEQFASTGAEDSRNRIVGIPDGDHVLFSRYIESDHEAAYGATLSFLESFDEESPER